MERRLRPWKFVTEGWGSKIGFPVIRLNNEGEQIKAGY